MITYCNRDGCHHADCDHVLNDLGGPNATPHIDDDACQILGCDCAHFVDDSHPEMLEIDNGEV